MSMRSTFGLCPILTHPMLRSDVLIYSLHTRSSFSPRPSFLGLFLHQVSNPFFVMTSYKCAIKELVVCNHRMWPTVNSCWRVSLWSCMPAPLLNQTPPTPQPEWWDQQEEERKQVIHMSDSNLPQQIHSCSHWVLPCSLHLFGSYRHVGVSWKCQKWW